MSVPLLFLGKGVRTGELSSTPGLDQIAPTLEPSLGLVRPHPEVRDGAAIPGVAIPGRSTPLVVMIVWKWVGMREIPNAVTPWFNRISSRAGSTSEPRADEPGIAAGLATAGSLPLDPTAVESTIGTGGLPSQHGITGTWVRNDTGAAGACVRAGRAAARDRFTRGRPGSRDRRRVEDRADPNRRPATSA